MSGYDSEVIGLNDGFFYPIHVTGIVTLVTSLICAITVIVLSFKVHRTKSFYLWPKSERFIVYLSFCEAMFNFIHIFDHVQMAVTRTHVFPPALCRLYAFLMVEFLAAKNYLLVFIAVNAFILIRFHVHLNLGRKDWRLMAAIFGLPLISNAICLSYGLLGPTGAFCTVVQGLGNLLLTILPIFSILFTTCLIYTLTCLHIRHYTKELLISVGRKAQSIRGFIQASRSMCLFVLVFCIQWWAVCVYSVWQLVTPHTPSAVILVVVFFTNIGGILCCVVHHIIHRGMRATNIDAMAHALEMNLHVRDINNGIVVLNTIADPKTTRTSNMRDIKVAEYSA